MASENSEPQRLLQEGIRAARAGDRERARELLLQTVEQEETIELAWLWLSEVLDDPADKVTALENALAINPANIPAEKRLAQLREALPPVGPPPPPAEAAAPPAASAEADAASRDWQQYLPESPLEADDGIDDPYQCVYCGKPTGVEDQACPHCGQKLYLRVSTSQNSEFLRLANLLMGITLALGLVDMLGPLLALSNGSQSGSGSGFGLLLDIFGVEAFFGDFTRIPLATAEGLIVIYLLRAGLLFGLLLMLNQRWAVVYYAAIGVMIADILWTIYLVATGYLGLVGSVANLGFAVAILVLLFASDREFPIHPERLLTQPDTAARSALDFYKRGHGYRRQGMWALAVAQWRKAVGLAPKETQYYKDLGIGYAKIKRFERSLRALAEAQHQAPQDATIAEIIALVREQAARDAGPQPDAGPGLKENKEVV